MWLPPVMLLVSCLVGFVVLLKTASLSKSSLEKHHKHNRQITGTRFSILGQRQRCCPVLLPQPGPLCSSQSLSEAAKAGESRQMIGKEPTECWHERAFAIHCRQFHSQLHHLHQSCENSELNLPAKCITFRKRSSDVIYLWLPGVPPAPAGRICRLCCCEPWRQRRGEDSPGTRPAATFKTEGEGGGGERRREQ